MRNMSFRLTEQQFLDGTKTVTRRLGWKFLKPGDRVRAVRQARGLPKGAHVHVLGIIEIVSVRREPLWHISYMDPYREGFPEMKPDDFMLMFCRAFHCTQHTEITRIEFRRIK